MNSDFLPHRGKAPNKNQQPNTWERPTKFRTPDQVAAVDDSRPMAMPTPPSSGSAGGQAGKSKKSLKEWLKHLTKRQWAILLVVAVVVLGGLGFGAYHLWFNDTPVPVKKAVTEKPAVTQPAAEPLTSTLSGLPITDAAINDRPVTAVMIENSTDARPQAGLNDASVVFEAVAEGGITRFLTLWQDTAPEAIGPVRSVRPYYLQWLMGFDASVAHVGGSGDALRMIKDLGVKDLDQFHNTGPYWRVSNRYAPHNMFTSIPKLQALEAQKGFGKSNYVGFARKKEAANATPNARTIDFNISGAIYNSHYDYDAASNSYLRSEGGKTHTDANSGQQISAKVVVGLVMPQGKNGLYTTYQTIGSGHAFIFQDGVATEGTWTKSDNKSQFTFKDANGAEIKLNPGKTWLTVVGSTDRVSYKP
jgi:hypothetical protein